MMIADNTLHDFSRWAFGEDYLTLKVDQFVPRWNILHGHKYKITDASDEEQVIKKMKEIWLDSVAKDNKDRA